MRLVDNGVNRSFFNDDGRVLFLTDLSKDDKWECRKCGKCCRGVLCKKLIVNDCSNYNNRPLVCKLFPMSVMAGDHLMFIKSSYCPGWGKGNKVNFNGWIRLMQECAKKLNEKLVQEWVNFFK